jgi:hypothetical protein
MDTKLEKASEDFEVMETLPVVFNRDPIQAMKEAQGIVKAMSKQCEGEKFIANIQGKRYPKVEWWTTVGAVKGLFPYTVSSIRLDREGEIIYESRVEVRNSLNGMAITAAEAICSDKEKRWSGRDEYAIKSMSITRATAKAYRIGLSFLAVLAGLEATPAEEVPHEGFTADNGNGGRKEWPKYEKKVYAPVDLTGIEKPQIETERGMIRDYILANCEGSEDAAKLKLFALSGKYAKAVNSTIRMSKEQVHGVYLELKSEIEMFDTHTKQ